MTYLAKMIRQALTAAGGELVVLDIIHSPECRRPHGEPCSCEPRVEITRRQEVVLTAEPTPPISQRH